MGVYNKYMEVQRLNRINPPLFEFMPMNTVRPVNTGILNKTLLFSFSL